MLSLICLEWLEILEHVPSSSSKRGDKEEELGKGWSGVGAASSLVLSALGTSEFPPIQ